MGFGKRAPSRLAGLALLAILFVAPDLLADRDTAKTRVSSGVTKYYNGDFAGAEGDFTNAMADDGDDTWAVPYNNRGLARLKQGRFAEALEDFADAKERDSAYVAPYINAAKCYAAQKDWDNAVAQLNAGLVKSPNNPKLLYNLGWVRDAQGNETAAATHFQAAIAANANHTKAKICLGIARARQGDDAAAVTQFYRAITEAETDDFNIQIAAYDLQLLRGNGQAFPTAQAADDYYEGIFLFSVEQYTAAIARLQAAQAAAVLVADVPWMIMWCRTKLRQSTQAANDLQAARALMPTLTVRSRAAGAGVYVDGVRRGTTPVTLYLFPSRYDVSVRGTNEEWVGPVYTDGTPGPGSTVSVNARWTKTGFTAFGPVADVDRDWIADSWETRWLNTTSYGRTDDQTDQDGVNNLTEFWNGTSPVDSDSDGDGASDQAEISAGTDPTRGVATFYVNDSSTAGDQWCTAAGNDGRNGRSPATPKATVQAVLRDYRMEPGSVICVDTGTYNLSQNVGFGAFDAGSSSAPVTLRGATGGTTINRGSTTAGSYAFDLQETGYIRLENLRITGGEYGVRMEATMNAPSDMVNCVVYGNTYGVMTRTQGRLTVADCTVVNNVTSGIGNLVATRTPPAVVSCVVWGNGDDLVGCTATFSCIEDGDAGAGNISVDPRLDGRFHLRPDSPCINTGSSAGVPAGLTTDMDGETRTYGVVDMGADEYVPVQPDAQIRVHGETGYVGAEVFNADGTDQTKTRATDYGLSAVYDVRVVNRGNATENIAIAGPGNAGGWERIYFGNVQGTTNVTAQVTVGGWSSPDLAPGEALEFAFSVKPGTTVVPPAVSPTLVSAALAGTPALRDVVRADTSLASPDLLIRAAAEADAAYALDNVYQTVPAGDQVETGYAVPGDTISYAVKIQNDGLLTRSLVVKAEESGEAGFTVHYLSGTQDVTAAVRGAGFRTPSLGAGGSHVLTVSVSPDAAAAANQQKRVTLRLFYDGDTRVCDAVQAVTGLVRADLLVRAGPENDSAYALDNVYQSAPEGDQVEMQEVAQPETVRYWVKVQNDSATARAFVLKAAESTEAGWRVLYKVGETDITAQIKGTGGYPTALLNAYGGSALLQVELTPGAGVAGGTRKSATVRVHLDAADRVARDAVQAVASVRRLVRPDLLIRRATEADSAYGTNDVYQTEPADNQVERQSLLPGVAASYVVKVQNDGNTAGPVTLKGQEAGTSGWTVVYRVGGQDVTARVRAGTYVTPALAPGAGMAMVVEMTPVASLAAGAQKSVTLMARLSATDTAVQDAVRAISTVCPPDLLVKSSTEADSAYGLDNVYQGTPSGGQIRTQSALPGKMVRFTVRVQNESGARASFVVKAATTTETGWTVAYKTTAGTVTPQSAAGYTTPVLAAERGIQAITVEMTPGSAVRAGTRKSATLKVYLNGTDTRVRDAVQVIATAGEVIKPDLLIKANGEANTAYALDNTYLSSPAGSQIERLSVRAGVPARYWVKVQNDGNGARRFVLKASESAGAGWTVTYKVGISTVTPLVVSSSGYATPVLPAFGGSLFLFVEAKPRAGTAPGAVKNVTLRVYAAGTEAVARDAVLAATTVVR